MRPRFLPEIIAFAIAVLAFAGCELLSPNPGPDPITTPVTGGGTTAPPDSTPPTLERGAQLFAQYCSRCHGDSAQGSTIWPTPLQGRTLPIDSIVHFGRRAMPGFPALSDSAIASIMKFLQSFKVDVVTKTGRELFVTYCSKCHGDSALGTSTFPGSIQGHDSIEKIVRFGRGEMKPVDMPTDGIAKIQEYLLSLKVDLTKVSGREFYARECAKCHGAEGEGTTRGWEIRNPVAGYSAWVVRNGRPVGWFPDSMPKYTTAMLSEQQWNEILAWLRSAAHPTDGKGLYNRFCLNCHAANARGGPAGKNLKNELGEAREKIRNGEGGTRYSTRTKYMPKWTTSELTDAEVDLIIAYIRTL